MRICIRARVHDAGSTDDDHNCGTDDDRCTTNNDHCHNRCGPDNAGADVPTNDDNGGADDYSSHEHHSRVSDLDSRACNNRDDRGA